MVAQPGPTLPRVLATAVLAGALAGAIGILDAAPASAARVPGGNGHAAAPQLPISAATATRAADGSYQLTWTQAPYVRGVSVYASTDPRVDACAAVKVATGATGSAAVTGLDPTRRWYFHLTPDGVPLGVEVADRRVTIAGVANARDIGGYPTASGRPVRWGVVFHSARLTTATPAGLTELDNLGLVEVVDFRNDAERLAGGPDPLPAGVVEISDPIGNPDQAESTPPPPVPVDPITAGYLLFVTNSHLRAEFGDALTRMADAAQRPMLFHDTGGNNRVGWMTVIVLSALGVPRDVIYQDYLLSTGLVSASYLDATFAEVTRDYGSFDAYLTSGLGVSHDTLAALRTKLLQPRP